MTDNQRAYEAAICEVAHVNDIGDVSDGFHTFNQLYHQRAMLFAALVNQNRDISWKSRKHEDGKPCFGGGWFVVTIDTPAGPYGYHYEDKYWDMFRCKELECAKHWDGYTEEDVGRLMSLPDTAEWIYAMDKCWLFATCLGKNIVKCSKCGNTLDMDGVNAGRGDANFCPNCGKKMSDNGRAKTVTRRSEEESSTHCETCKNYESMSDITGWCSACPGTVIRSMNANNTCAPYEKRED